MRLMGRIVSGLVRLFQGYSKMNSPRIKLLPVWLLAVLMLAGVSQSNAAIALLDTGNKTIIRGGGGSTAFSAAATVSSGAKVLVVMVVNKGAGGGDAYPASLLWQGQTVLKAIGTNNTQGTWRDASIYYLWNPTAASGNITGTFLQSVNDYWVSIYTLTGVDSTVAPLTGSTNATTANSIAFTVNSVPANGWAATCANYANGTGANGFILGVTNAGAASGIVTSNAGFFDTTYNTPMMMSYASGLTAGTTTFTATETYSAGGTANQKMAFVGAIFTPLKGTPAITTNLTNQTVFSGANATFVVGATSDTTISYGWYTNGVRNPSANTNSYTFSNAKLVDNGRTFQVYLTNSLGVSTSALATLTVMPVAPTGLTATGGTNRVALSWAAADGATNYVIQQSTTNGGPYTRIATNATTSYANTSLSNGTTYYYVVLAQTALGESANSAQASAITVPAAPASLTSLPGNNQVTLNWTASTGAVSYVVKRSLTSGSGYAPITTNGSLSFVDTTAVNLTTYYYVVAARNAAGDSATNSPEASSMPNTSPINVGAVGSSGKITLVWDALTGATSYNIKRGASSGGPYITIASGVTDTFYQNTGLSDGAIFYYVISAQLAGGESANSSEVFASTSILAPTGLTATPVSISEIDLSWTSGGAGATLYKIERSADGLTYTQIATTTGTSYANSNLTVATKYYYRVRASNGVTDSPYSNFAQGITYSLMVAVNFATPAFTNYPGYLEDYGYAYADRGNGYSYGWNVDTSGDARTRLSGVSPDGRYDSLVHLMKGDPANPTNSHTWKIALPNGNYTVHVVGGDPTATDMDMQFLLNGGGHRGGGLASWDPWTLG